MAKKSEKEVAKHRGFLIKSLTEHIYHSEEEWENKALKEQPQPQHLNILSDLTGILESFGVEVGDIISAMKECGEQGEEEVYRIKCEYGY